MPIIVMPGGRPLFGPVVVPAPVGDEADRLWNLCVDYASFGGLYELKTPKNTAALTSIAGAFEPYLRAREWATIERSAP